MRLIKEANRVAAVCRQEAQAGKQLALVPTMGALHRGHLSLVEIAKTHADLVAMSIFVNPAQFNVPEDLEKYPRTLEADLVLAEQAGVDLVFAPAPEEIYTETRLERGVRVRAGSRSKGLCGSSRPGHFDGVVHIVSILFNLTRPDFAVFGEKDYQQLKVIEQLAADLHYPVQIVPGPLVRDQDGLALSSRNVRLSTDQRKQACAIPHALFAAAELVKCGEQSAAAVVNMVRERLSGTAALKVDYVEVVDTETLEQVDTIEQQAQLLVAVFCGAVRLIDNIRLSVAR